MVEAETKWEWVINSKTSYLGTPLAEIWSYRHLLVSFVRKSFLVQYQQTVLGPAWILLQPLLTLLTYVLIFGKVVGLSTGSIPPVLFYFSGIILWGFFSDSFSGTSGTFRDNASVFNKVYFPRLIVPISILCTQLIRFAIQLFILVLMIAYQALFNNYSPSLGPQLLLLPIPIMAIGAVGLGTGLIFSVLTAKYRDFASIVTLGIRLLMFATPVIYPLTMLPQNRRWIIELNPLTPFFELFRLSLLGEGVVNTFHLALSLFFITILLVGALLLFNKKGDTLIDII